MTINYLKWSWFYWVLHFFHSRFVIKNRGSKWFTVPWCLSCDAEKSSQALIPHFIFPSQQLLFLSSPGSNQSFKMEQSGKSLTLSTFVPSLCMKYFCTWWSAGSLNAKSLSYAPEIINPSSAPNLRWNSEDTGLPSRLFIPGQGAFNNFFIDLSA